MYGELPKLFDREFAIGYFLPVIAFLSSSVPILGKFQVTASIYSAFQLDTVPKAAIIAFIAWILAVLLLALNREITRFYEGYHFISLLKILRWRQIARYHSILIEAAAIASRETELTSNELQQAKRKRGELQARLAREFPEDEVFILPTSFGNSMRALERHSDVLYGLDSIIGWNRLLSVVPKDFRQVMDSARSFVDFWLNVSLLSSVTTLSYIAVSLVDRPRVLTFNPGSALLFVSLAWALTFVAVRLLDNKLIEMTWQAEHARQQLLSQTLLSFLGAVFLAYITTFSTADPSDLPWIPIVSSLLAFYALSRANRAAQRWGEWVKSAFDVFLPELCLKMRFVPPKTAEGEINLWSAFTQSVLYRSRDLVVDRSHWEARQNTKEETSSESLRSEEEKRKVENTD